MPMVPDGLDYGTVDYSANRPATPTVTERPSALDTAAAAFRQNNVVSSVYTRLTEPSVDTTPVAGYDALDDMSGYEDRAHRFFRSESPAETQQIKSRIDGERADDKTIHQAGGWGLAAAIVAGTTDIATLASMAIPGGGLTRVGRLANMIGTQVAVDSASELAFQQLQETRTTEESFLNVGSSALLTGILGTIATRVPRGELKELNEAVRRDWSPDSTVGAASASQQTTIAQETIARGGETIAKTIGRISPLNRVLTGSSKRARQIVQQLGETPYLMAKNEQGVASEIAVETAIKQHDAVKAQAVMATDNFYGKYRERVKATGEKPLSVHEFKEEVGLAMFRKDFSEIPEAASQAAFYRSKVIDPYTKQLQKAKLLGDELETIGAQSYRPRLYDIPRIKAQPTEWREMLVNHFVQGGADRAEAATAANTITNNILGSTRGQVALDPGVVIKAGPLQDRTLTVPDELLRPWLVNDAEKLMVQYVETIAPQLELAKKFETPDMKAQFDEITDEYGALIEAATSNKEKARLQDELKSTLDDVRGMRDRLTGQAGAPSDPESMLVRGQRLIRSYNYVRLLGSQTFSSLADVGRIITQHGMAKTGTALAKFVTNMASWKMARTDAKRLGIGLDWVLNTRGKNLMEVGDFATTRAEEFARAAANQFTRITGMATWNSSMKFLTTALEQDGVLEAVTQIASGKGVSKLKLGKLAQLGIDEDMARRVAAQFEKHGETDGMRRARSELWEDPQAANVFEAAMMKSADTMVLTKGAGDTPLLMSGETAKTLLQFQGFGMAAVNRLLIPAAQGVARGDLAMMNGLMVMLALGVMRYYAKQTTSGQPVETDPGTLIREAFDGAGLTAYMIQPYDAAAGFIPGLPRFSRFQDRGLAETLGGPTLGTLGDTREMMQGFKDADLSRKDIHRIRKLAPYQNWFVWRRLLNQLEEKTGDAVGASD